MQTRHKHKWTLVTFSAILAMLLLLPDFATASEPSLQAIFDGLFGPGAINVAANETGAETFMSGTKESELLVEFAGNAGSNTLGWYPVSDSNQLHTIFSGSAGAGTVVVVTIPASFGLFFSTPDGLWRSQPSLNADSVDHFQTFNHPNVPGGVVVGMEDLSGGGDRDYQDMVISIKPIDETAPVVNIIGFPSPTGQNGWFVASPVMGSVSANDTTTGGSNITAITCTDATVGPITGLDTPGATASLTVSAEGVSNIICTATDSAGNNGAGPGSSNTGTIKIDTIAPAVATNPGMDSCSLPGNAGWCQGTQTAGFSVSDATSGVATPCIGASCVFPQSTTTNGSAVSIPSGPVCDVAGNCNPGINAGPYMIDSEAPTVIHNPQADACSLPGNAGWCRAIQTAGFNANDATSGVASPCAGLSCNFTQSSTTNGSAVLIPSGPACDVAGNCNPGIDAGPYMIDSVLPTVVRKPEADACSLPGNAGWCRGTQTAGFSAGDATSGVASPCAGTACDFTQPNMSDGSAVSIPSGAVCDVAGNCDPGLNAGPYMIDSQAPGISIASPAADGTHLLNAVVASSYSCSDATSGVATCAGPVTNGANISTNPVGAHAFSVTAADVAGNPAEATNNYNVIYNFGGFFQPVDNLPMLNMVKAGSAVAVNFSLGGNQGLTILAAGYPGSQPITCNTSAPVDDIEQTVTAGGSSLTYDAASDQYTYIWKTDKAWTGSCRQLIVRFSDGTDHKANFKFK